MAERLDDYDFAPIPPPRRRCPYPIDQWADGEVWRIWHGEDYDVPFKNMQSRLHFYAGKRLMRVRTRAVQDGEREGLVFQFFDREPPHGAGSASQLHKLGWS